MKAADRLERAMRFTVHHLFKTLECRADDVCRRIVNTGVSRRIAVIDRAVAFVRQDAHAFDVIARVKTLDLLRARFARLAQRYPFRQPLLLGFLPERVLPVGPERMPIGKAIAAERVAHIQLNFTCHRCLRGRILRAR
jgi:hypothetical protein